ncbi:MAG: hypothetical protein GWN77_01110 [Gammaproteobacteria bacterium]|nr:hypothetical protein [Gammaproteobacteria bacterium]
MEKEPLTRFTWRGQETVEKVMSARSRAMCIEILLPANYNHALFRLLYPGETQTAVESLNYAGGPELLVKIASIAGLEPLTALGKALSSANATIQLTSPPTLIITFPNKNREQ